MVDRLEELLALLEDEEREEQEDGLALKPGAEVPAPPVPGVGKEKILEENPVLEKEDASAEAGGAEWTPERQKEVSETGAAGSEAAVFLWDELAQTMTGPNGTAVLRRPGTGDMEMTEPVGTAEKTAAAKELDSVTDTLTAAEWGLEGLYRQTVQAGRPAAQTLPVEQAGRTVRAEEPGRTAALTVDELDRAVRRDSRRYDGGLTLF